ncbi:hypothetical protein pb186bvf_016237 [Paramecium bursaria]
MILLNHNLKYNFIIKFTYGSEIMFLIPVSFNQKDQMEEIGIPLFQQLHQLQNINKDMKYLFIKNYDALDESKLKIQRWQIAE